MKNKLFLTLVLTVSFLFNQGIFSAHSQSESELRRPISPSSPMWIVHIDTWNYPDPQKIIDLIPKDVRPYVIMNISLSISHNTTTGQFQVAEYGYEIAKSWLRVCAQNRMWAMVQVASGGYHQTAFSDFDLSVYEEFYREFPNFIGFNYAEQFWGFGDADIHSAKWVDRINHFTNLLKITNKWGGYLVVSWCSNQWGQSINPIGMLKRNPSFAEACKKYSQNYILCEKYTQVGYNYDTESLCLGAYLSGYSGQYGIRYDNSGWTDSTGVNENFTLATGLAPHLEHMMFTGETVIDGPEIIWVNCFKGLSDSNTKDGYKRREWGTYARFDNVMMDMFRKVLDGTVRIPTRKEVIDRTKYVVVNDISSGSDNDIYCSAQSQFEGLYAMDGNLNYETNKTFFKKSGRYPTIPTVFQLADDDANSFKFKINKSGYDSRWSSVSAKVSELNSYFPQEYTGDIYAARTENTWLTYNPYKTDQLATGSIPFQYNTCEKMELTYSRYSIGLIKEYANNVVFYLNNYDDEVITGLKKDVVKIYGSISKPTWTSTERGSHQASQISESWVDGILTLTVLHNGPLEINVNCQGNQTERLTSFTPATLVEPQLPDYYTGPLQYEAECFDRKNTSTLVTGGQNGTFRNYTGQGYIQFGTSSTAGIRDTVTVLKAGSYKLDIRYTCSGGSVSTTYLSVNGKRITSLVLSKTASDSDWSVISKTIDLKAGNNSIAILAASAASYGVTFDNIVLTYLNGTIPEYDFENDVAGTAATNPPAQYVDLKSGSAGVVSYTDANQTTSNGFKAFSVDNLNASGVADLNLFPSQVSDSYITWKNCFTSTGGKVGVLMRASGGSDTCQYAKGMKQGYLFVAQSNSDNTVTLKQYIASEQGITLKASYVTSFTLGSNQPCWFRASATGDTLRFECSSDNISWVGGTTTVFSDKTYTTGSSQLVWGLESDNLDWYMDDILCSQSRVSLSVVSLTSLGYTEGATTATPQSFLVSGYSLTDNINIAAPDNFEISLASASGYTSSLSLSPVSGTVVPDSIYVRSKLGLSANVYTGSLFVRTNGETPKVIKLKATIATDQDSVSKMYDFSSDYATTSAQTPPASNTSIGVSNGATAGVVYYTNANGQSGNALTGYSGGVRNGTGIINLNKFSKTSTDYSVTWKQYNGSSDYKVGVLLRGSTSNVGDASNGYVQGMMQGYVFIVYNKASGGSEFRIYKSTSSTSLTMLNNTGVSTLTPTAGQAMWYRASVSGYTSAALKLEYSTDSITWNTGSTAADAPATFKYGATQLVWGLAASSSGFYMDNITFNGIESPAGVTDVTISSSSLSGFKYTQPSGPSSGQSFNVTGTLLTDSVLVSAAANYEVSLSQSGEYASFLYLKPVNNNIAQTPIYVRLASGLISNAYYKGNMFLMSSEIATKVISLSGSVSAPTQPVISASVDALDGFDYELEKGPSTEKVLVLSGYSLSDVLTVSAPENFEVMSGVGSGYSSSVSFTPNSGTVSAATVYVRLKAGLSVENYAGNLIVSSTGAESKQISVSGNVSLSTGIVNHNEDPATVLSTEYYTLAGQRIMVTEASKGLFIVKKKMSDGTMKVSKIFVR
jgi:hypothetical protein